MKTKDIIKQKVGYFVSLKYTDIFCDLLRNIKKIIKEEEDNKFETFFQRYYKEKKSETIKDKIQSYITKIKKAMFTEEKFLNYTFSQLEIKYLKNKAKKIRKKIKLLSLELQKKTSILTELYIRNCKKELKLLTNPNEHKIKNIRLSRNKQNDDEDEDEEQENINLFIGKFDYKKYLDQVQIVKLKKTGFVNAFIFQDINSGIYENRLQTFKAPSLDYKKRLNKQRSLIRERKKEKIIIDLNEKNNNLINENNKEDSVNNHHLLTSKNLRSKSSRNYNLKLNYTNREEFKICNEETYNLNSKRKLKINRSLFTEIKPESKYLRKIKIKKPYINLSKKPYELNFFLRKKDLYY